jgi:hypothetical protein
LVNTRQIHTAGEQASCDVCGRTLLRGERAEVYVTGGSRRSVCELCTTRAVHEGWVREGTLPAVNASETSADGRRSLLGRLRSRREAAGGGGGDAGGAAGAAGAAGSRHGGERGASARRADPGRPAREPVREPRHVRAVPTSAEHKVASAVDMFNGSEHCRTVAGVARSLGVPGVSVRPSENRASVVNVVVSWELCWYRYEVDLDEEAPAARLATQGTELEELARGERAANTPVDETGLLSSPAA